MSNSMAKCHAGSFLLRSRQEIPILVARGFAGLHHLLLSCLDGGALAQKRPRALMLTCFLLTVSLHAVSGLVTEEHAARAQELLRENLHATLAHWHGLRADNAGKKLTMQNFFKTANKHMHHPAVAFWGIKNNKVFQLNKDGELRNSSNAMIAEGRPNRGAAGVEMKKVLSPC
eukprot:1137369-Pelagomonas_calceolata.AAC.1